jgi:hypothetical protein
MKRLTLAALVSLMLLSTPAWSHPGFTDAKGCHTNRNWERHCHDTVNLASDAVGSALGRAKDKAPATYAALDSALVKAGATAPDVYAAMEQARIKASGRSPGAYKMAKAAEHTGVQAGVQASASGRVPGAFRAARLARL